MKKNSELKVISITSKANLEGYHFCILIDREGYTWEVGIHKDDLPELGGVLIGDTDFDYVNLAFLPTVSATYLTKLTEIQNKEAWSIKCKPSRVK